MASAPREDGKILVRLTMFEDPYPVFPDEVENLHGQGLVHPDELPRLRADGHLPADPAAAADAEKPARAASTPPDA